MSSESLVAATIRKRAQQPPAKYRGIIDQTRGNAGGKDMTAFKTFLLNGINLIRWRKIDAYLTTDP